MRFWSLDTANRFLAFALLRLCMIVWCMIVWFMIVWFMIKPHDSIAAILTMESGRVENGRLGEVSETGFQFHGERYLFIKYPEVMSIDVDTNLIGKALERERILVHQIQLQLDPSSLLEHQLQSQVIAWLDKKEYASIEAKAKLLNQSQAQWPSGRWKIDSFYNAMLLNIQSRDVAQLIKRLDQVAAWQQALPHSVTAKIASMKVLLNLAWAYRGSGYSNTVTEQGMDDFLKTLEQLIEIGESLRTTSTNDLQFYQLLITAKKGAGVDKQELIRLAKESSRKSSRFHLPYRSAMVGLLPKWGGAAGATEELSHWINRLVEDDSPEVIYLTHRSLIYSISDEDYKSMSFNWTKIKKGFEHFKAIYQTTDEDMHLMFKLSCLHEDRVSAKGFSLNLM